MRKFKIIQKVNIIWLDFVSVPIFITVLFLLRFSPKFQLLALVLAAGLYFMTAIIYHLRDKSLTLEIVVEYILIVALALILFQSLFF